MKILMYDNGQPFDIDTPYTSSLGGSESSVLLLSKGLEILGNSVVICNSRKGSTSTQNNLMICHNNSFHSLVDESDIIICNRSFPQGLETYIGKKPIYYYAHDAYDQQLITNWMYNYNLINALSGILCVSEWQKHTFTDYFNIPNDLHHKFQVVGNSIDISLSYGYTKKYKNRLIFAGIPYKGIDVLKKVFDSICVKSERDDLDLHVFSSMSLYGNKDADREYEQQFKQLNNTKNIHLHDSVNLNELTSWLGSSSVYLSPSTYHETFGMLLVQAQAVGCIPVTMNNGAVNEVIQNNQTGYISKYPNIQNSEGLDDFVSLVCDVLKKDDTYKMELQARDWAKQWDYIKTANKVNDILNSKQEIVSK